MSHDSGVRFCSHLVPHYLYLIIHHLVLHYYYYHTSCGQKIGSFQQWQYDNQIYTPTSGHFVLEWEDWISLCPCRNRKPESRMVFGESQSTL